MKDSEPGSPKATAGAARMTPYELAFASNEWELRVFPSLEREAESTNLDPLLRDRFGFLTLTGDALREVVPPDLPPEALEEYRLMLFHAFNFWRFGKRVYYLEPALARYLVEAAPSLQGWEFALPFPSIYVQLPANLFWASITPESTPEPVDGFFAAGTTTSTLDGGTVQRLEVLLVLGIRRDRAGFSVIPFETEAGPGIPKVWADTPGREQGKDFANILPGGEISGLYSILTTAEALKLLARALWYVEAHPDLVAPGDAPERGARDRPGSPPGSRLSYFRVSVAAPAEGAAE